MARIRLVEPRSGVTLDIDESHPLVARLGKPETKAPARKPTPRKAPAKKSTEK